MTLPPASDAYQSELRTVRDLYGVDDQQAQRDHAISLILAGISEEIPGDAYFFGGTAINRTHVTPGRLSEDIDLIAVHNRAETIVRLKAVVEVSLQRSHGRVRWTTDFSHSDVQPAIATTSDGTAVKIQVLSLKGYPNWPFEMREIDQHFQSVAPAQLRVPTLPASIAWKTATWMDRRASRDLYDLRSLARNGPFTPEAVDLFVHHGPTGRRPARWVFAESPRDDWYASLSGQTVLDVTAEEARIEVRDAWAMVLGEDWSQPQHADYDA